MRPLDAVEAISPAWAHTRQVVLAPRRWQHLLKLGALALFAGGGSGGSFNFNSPGLPRNGGSLPGELPAHLLAAFVVVAVVATILGLLFFYLSSRLQFVLFEVIATRQTRLWPIWRRYSGIVWRWIGLKLLFFVIALLCVAPILVPVLWTFVHQLSRQGGAVEPGQFAGFFAAILGFIAVVFLLLLLIGIAFSLLRDFGLPSMALEGVSMGESVRRVIRLVRAEPVQVLVYLLMKSLLAIAGAIASYIAILLGVVVLAIPLGGGAYALWAGLHSGGSGALALMFAGWVVLGLLAFAALLVASSMTVGLLLFFLESYAVFFLAGRYPLLANLLAPSAPPAAFTPPPPPQGFPSPPSSLGPAIA